MNNVALTPFTMTQQLKQMHLPVEKSLVMELAVIGTLLGLIYHPILIKLVEDWSIDPNYSHGFLIPLISGYLIWERRKTLGETEIKPYNMGVILLLMGIFILIVGNIASELFTKRFSLLVVLSGIILFMMGKEFAKKLLFPLAFLIFMIPLPYILYDAIAFPLKLFASRIATLSLLLVGIPVLREGNIIYLANTTLEVADACSGIRSLMSLMALGVIFAYISQNHLWKKITLVILTVPIAVIANAFRVTGTGFLSHYYGQEVAEGFFHTFSGWLIFIVAFVLLFASGLCLKKIGNE
ncbi:MAG TPA: exosortase [Syntrophaceae bacterium]|nr:exosortase [Syntrophaceae bacterium]